MYLLHATDGTTAQTYEQVSFLAQQLQTVCGLDLSASLPTPGDWTPETWNPQPALDVLSTAKEQADTLPKPVHSVPAEEYVESNTTLSQLMSDPTISDLRQVTRDDRTVAQYQRQEELPHPLLLQLAAFRDFLLAYQQGGYTLRVA